MEKRLPTVGFTGSRHGMTQQQLWQVDVLLQQFKDCNGAVWFHHGDCCGADAQAHHLASDLSYATVIHPPCHEMWRAFCTPVHGGYSEQPVPYLVRNRAIVTESDVIIGTPASMADRRGGTWWTLREATRRGKRVYVVPPGGGYEFTPEKP